MWKTAQEYLDWAQAKGVLDKAACERIAAVRGLVERHPRMWKEAGFLGEIVEDMSNARARRILASAVKRVSRATEKAEEFAKLMQGIKKKPALGLEKDVPGVLSALEGIPDEMKEKYLEGAVFKSKPSIRDMILTQALPAAAIGSAPLIYGALTEARRREATLQQMLELHPNLQQEDPEAVRRAHQIVHTYAPSLAADPLSAGHAVSKFVQFDAVDPDHLEKLLSIDEAMRKQREGWGKVPSFGWGSVMRTAFSPFGKKEDE